MRKIVLDLALKLCSRVETLPLRSPPCVLMEQGDAAHLGVNLSASKRHILVKLIIQLEIIKYTVNSDYFAVFS